MTQLETTGALDRRLIALMAAAQANDHGAYRELLRACEPVIRRIGQRRGVNDDCINDVVQETLLTLHHARQTYDPSRSFLAWLTVIAQRRAIDTMRRRGRNGRREMHLPAVYENHPDPVTDPSEVWQHASRVRILSDALATLPKGQRDAVERLALREQTLVEAATESGKSTGSLKVNLHRALKALRSNLGKQGYPD